MEQKGYVWIGYYTNYVTLSYDLDFEGQFFKSSIIAIRGWIDMEPKGWESIGCWTQVATLNFDLTHDPDLGFS